MSRAMVSIHFTDESVKLSANCINFIFEKDRYTPYTKAEGSFIFNYDDVDLSKVFDKYRSRLAFTMVDNLLYAIMKSDADKFTDNIVNNKKILALWSEVTKRLYNPKNLKEARLSAFYNMPKEYQSLYTLNEDGTCELKEGVSKWKSYLIKEINY